MKTGETENRRCAWWQLSEHDFGIKGLAGL
jgi:hypothetical protein